MEEEGEEEEEEEDEGKEEGERNLKKEWENDGREREVGGGERREWIGLED